MDVKRKTTRFSINYDTLPYKIHYLLFFAAKGAILPFIILFFKDKLHLSPATLSTMVIIRSFLIVIVKPSIGAIVDYFNKLKLVMVCLTVGEIIFYFMLLIIPSIESEPNGSQISLKRNDILLNDEYFYAAFQSEGNVFTIFQDQNHFKNESQEYLKFNVTLQCSGTMNVNETYCSLISNDLDRHLNVEIYNKLWQNSTFFSLTNENIYFNCSFDNWHEDATIIIRKEIQSNNKTIHFPYQKTSRENLFQGKIGCFWLNEISNTSKITHSTITDHLKIENSSILSAFQNEEVSVYNTYQYWLCGLIWLLAGSCSNAMFTLSDTACYECLQRTGEDYGKQRLWGAVSWGIVSPTIGFLNDYFSNDLEKPNYAPGFYAFGILAVLEILNLLRLDTVKPPRSSTFFKDFKKIFKSKEFDVFVTAVFMIGFFTSAIWYYLMLYVESIGGNRFLMGLLNTSQCFLGEIPFMFYSGWFTKKLGHMQVLVIGFSVFALRFICYYLIYNPWCFLPVEAMHGLTYALFYTAMTSFGKSSSVPGTEATTQSILCATYEGLGVGVGAILFGSGVNHFGYRSMFMIASISSLGCAMCLYIVSLIFKAKTKSMKLMPKINNKK